jgi:hypothetical protein
MEYTENSSFTLILLLFSFLISKVDTESNVDYVSLQKSDRLKNLASIKYLSLVV